MLLKLKGEFRCDNGICSSEPKVALALLQLIAAIMTP